MTTPRATSTEADELAATISGLKSRLNELETASGSGTSPVGAIVDYIGATAPNGWALLDGSTITNGQNLYPLLWTVLPSSFKSGANIVLPDTRGRVLVHRAAAGTLNVAVGSTGGAETVTLTESQMPVHSHYMGHDHGAAFFVANFAVGSGRTALSLNGTASTNYTDFYNANTGAAGSGQAHNNLQPYMVVVKIMKLT